MKYGEELIIDVNKTVLIQNEFFYIVDPKIEFKEGTSICDSIDRNACFLDLDCKGKCYVYFYDKGSSIIDSIHINTHDSLLYIRKDYLSSNKFKFCLSRIGDLKELDLSDNDILFSKNENIIKLSSKHYSFEIETKALVSMHNEGYITIDDIINGKYNMYLRSLLENDDWEHILIILQCLRCIHKVMYNSELTYLQKPRKK